MEWVYVLALPLMPCPLSSTPNHSLSIIQIIHLLPCILPLPTHHSLSSCTHMRPLQTILVILTCMQQQAASCTSSSSIILSRVINGKSNVTWLFMTCVYMETTNLLSLPSLFALPFLQRCFPSSLLTIFAFIVVHLHGISHFAFQALWWWWWSQ